MIPKLMKAAVLTAPKTFEIRQVAVPAYGDDEVLIRVTRCSICGTDIHIYNGHYSQDKLPLIPGHEFSGEIVAIGRQVSTLTPGQRVVADINIGCGHCYYCRRNELLNCPEIRQLGIHTHGAFAQYVAIPARLVIPIGDEIADSVACLTEPFSCVVRASKKIGLSVAESVVVIGAGPVGNMHIQMARLLGAAPIIAVELNPQRAELARQCGADSVITDPNARWSRSSAHGGTRRRRGHRKRRPSGIVSTGADVYAPRRTAAGLRFNRCGNRDSH